MIYTVEYKTEAELLEKLRDLMVQTSKTTGPGDLYKRLEKYAHKKQEHFFVIILDGAHNFVKLEVVTKGLVNRTIVHAREVFRPAIVASACAIIVAHNHPSGNLTPSSEDMEITERFIDAGVIIGIPVLDHIIFGPTGYRSMVETGEMPR